MTEILFTNLTLEDRSKRKPVKYIVEKQPFVRSADNMLHYDSIRDRRIIHKTKAKCDLYIVDVEVIKVVGETNKK